MRINPDFPIQQPVGVNQQKNTAERATGKAGDVLLVDANASGVRGADKGVRAAQDAMTLFRIADDALAKAQDAMTRMAELAALASEGETDDAARANMQIEVDNLAEIVRFAGDNTTMNGVSLFGASAETAALWNETMLTVDELSPHDDNTQIVRVAETGVGIPALNELHVGTRNKAMAAAAQIQAHVAELASGRETMKTQGERMETVAREQASLAVAHLTANLPKARITNADTAAGLMAFVRGSLGGTSEAPLLAQARQNPFDVAKINA